MLSQEPPPCTAPRMAAKNQSNLARPGSKQNQAVLLLSFTLVLIAGATLTADAYSQQHQQQHQHHDEQQQHVRVKRQDTTTAAPSTGTPTTLAPAEPEVTNSATTEVPSTSTSSSSTTSTTEASPRSKAIPPVNYTLVEDLFRADFPDEFVVAKWRNMSQLMSFGVKEAIKAVFPHVVAMSSDARVSGNCSGGILKWIINLKSLRSWAVQMLDAIGKPGSGIFEGALTMFGNYRQCLTIRAPDEDEIELTGEYKEYFRGQYCVLQLRPYLPRKEPFYGLNATYKPLLRNNYKYYEKTLYDELSELAMAFNFVNIRLDLCVPSLCSRDDIQRVADYLSKKMEMRAKVLRCDIEPLEGTPIADGHHFAWGFAMALALVLVLVSSLVSLLYGLSRTNKSKCRALLTSMSVRRSLSHYRSIDCDRLSARKPLAVYGLRFVVLLWIFLVHSAANLNFQFLREMLTLRRLIMDWPMQLIINSTLQFDTLVVLTAFTVAYYNVDSSMKDLIKYTIDKYVRLVVAIMFIVGLTILTPLFYENHSPVWKDFVYEQSEVCKSTGLLDLTFLQNFLAYSHICLPQTWLFCVELQLLVLTLPLIYMINRSYESKSGQKSLIGGPSFFLVVLAALGWLINFLSVYANQLPPAWLYTFPDKEDRAYYFTRHLTKTWNHLSPFAIGLLAGFICKDHSKRAFSGQSATSLPKSVGAVFWTSALALMLAIIYSTYFWSVGSLPASPVVSALYDATSRLLWSLACAAILFNVSVPDRHHQYSPVASFLGSAQLVALGRLSFLAYMIYPYVHTFVLAIQEQPMFSSIFMLFHTFMGNLILTYLLAFLLSILIELPFRRLVKKCALGRRHCTQLNISSQLSTDCESPTFMKGPASKQSVPTSARTPKSTKPFKSVAHNKGPGQHRTASPSSAKSRGEHPARTHSQSRPAVDAHPMVPFPGKM